jgi:DNA mismatch repair protein MutS
MPILFDTRLKPCMLIKEGVSPVIDGVGNSVYLDTSCKLVLLQGPNGAGKTTLLKTIAQLVIIAQAGCFVPCRSFKFSPLNSVLWLTNEHLDFRQQAEECS